MATFDRKAFYRSIPEIERLTREALSRLKDLDAVLGRAHDSSRSYAGMIRKFQRDAKRSRAGSPPDDLNFRFQFHRS